jgi:hypothetical protein
VFNISYDKKSSNSIEKSYIDGESENKYRVYDYNKLYPHARKASTAILGVFSLITFIPVIILGGAIPALILFLVFFGFFLRNLNNLKKNKVIAFEDNGMKISWHSVSQSIEEFFDIQQIKKIKLVPYSTGARYEQYMLEIHCINKTVKIKVSMVEFDSLENYVKWYCEKHNIVLVFN